MFWRDQLPFTTQKPAQKGTRPLTRNELYNLSKECREYAIELASHDQSRVSLKHCHEFNRWLPKVQSYDLLASELSNLKGARPVARWQVMIISALVGLLVLLSWPPDQAEQLRASLLYLIPLLLLGIYFLPERIYGTTIELVEAKVLAVVELLETKLQSNTLEFSEGAFHQVKENLQFARQELRQQIDLAYRARRSSPFNLT